VHIWNLLFIKLCKYSEKGIYFPYQKKKKSSSTSYLLYEKERMMILKDYFKFLSY